MTPLAAIHVKRKALGLDDDTYRALLERVTGKLSAKDMSHRERLKVVAEMDRQGAGPNSRSTRLEGPFAAKLQALWIAAWNLGLVRDRTDAAMLAFVERQTGIANTRFLLDAAEARKAVEALKKWLERGGVDWGQRGPAGMDDDRFRVAWAIYRKLVPGATYVGNLGQFRLIAGRLVGIDGVADLAALTDRHWHAVMNGLGDQVRAKAGGL